jgi:hypothetical protein
VSTNETFRLEPPSTLWVGDRAYRWAELCADEDDTHRCRIAVLTFENGWHVHIQWCTGSASTNWNMDGALTRWTEEPTTVEVWVYDDAGPVHDRSIPFVEPGTVRQIIDGVSRWCSPSPVPAGQLGDSEQGQAEDAEGVPPVADGPGRDDQAHEADELQDGQGDRPGL